MTFSVHRGPPPPSRPSKRQATTACIHCRKTLHLDGPLGWVHPDGSLVGDDGHHVTAVAVKIARRE